MTVSVAPDVLVIDDNADGREMLKMLLQLLGYQVEVAEDGPRGVAKVRSARPRVALVDIGLPGLDGYQVARQVRSDPDGKDVYLVALTGFSRSEDRQRAEEAGFDAFLVKPVDPDKLCRLLTERGACQQGEN